jgi:precorrin-6B methylase 2
MTDLAESLLESARAFQPACVLLAGAELDIFTPLSRGRLTAEKLARISRCDLRALTALLDALAALGFLKKQGEYYANIAGGDKFLTQGGSASVLPMLRHQANCLRRWSQAAAVAKSGRPARKQASILGEKGDRESFIGAMNAINVPVARQVVASLRLPRYRRLLDVGGASGTWTLAFLKAYPGTTATIFDLPPVIPMARKNMQRAGVLSRVRFAGGDYLKNPLPKGCDVACLSAIAHQNSRAENRKLFKAAFRALEGGGRILVRDIVMEESRVRPVSGALFAVNMLVSTSGGGTYTFAEYRDDLQAAGFSRVKWLRRDPGMHSVIQAIKQ